MTTETTLTIRDLRKELGLTVDQFAAKLGLASKGNASMIERGGRCSLAVALAIEGLSIDAVSGQPRIDAATLNDNVAAARAVPRTGTADDPEIFARIIHCACGENGTGADHDQANMAPASPPPSGKSDDVTDSARPRLRAESAAPFLVSPCSKGGAA